MTSHPTLTSPEVHPLSPPQPAGGRGIKNESAAPPPNRGADPDDAPLIQPGGGLRSPETLTTARVLHLTKPKRRAPVPKKCASRPDEAEVARNRHRIRRKGVSLTRSQKPTTVRVPHLAARKRRAPRDRSGAARSLPTPRRPLPFHDKRTKRVDDRKEETALRASRLFPNREASGMTRPRCRRSPRESSTRPTKE